MARKLIYYAQSMIKPQEVSNLEDAKIAMEQLINEFDLLGKGGGITLLFEFDLGYAFFITPPEKDPFFASVTLGKIEVFTLNKSIPFTL